MIGGAGRSSCGGRVGNHQRSRELIETVRDAVFPPEAEETSSESEKSPRVSPGTW